MWFRQCFSGSSIFGYLPVQQFFHQCPLLIQHAAADMIFQQMAVVPQRVEQAGVHGFFQRSLCHIDIRIRRERARFRTAVGVNVEESSSCCQTAAGAFLIAREGDKDHFRMLRAQPLDSRADGLALGVPRGEMLRLIGYRDKLNIKDRFAAAPGEGSDKGVGEYLIQILGGDRDGTAEEKPLALQPLHVGRDFLKDAVSAAGIRKRLVTLNADDGNQIPAAIEKLKISVPQEGAVCKDREEDVRMLPGSVNHVLAKQRLAPGKEDKADAQFLGLAKDILPLFRAELALRCTVFRGVVGAGIAAGAVKIAAGCDAGDEIGRDVEAFALIFSTALRRLF